MDSKNIIIGVLALTTLAGGYLWLDASSQVGKLKADNDKMAARISAATKRSPQRTGDSQQRSQRGPDDASRQRGPGAGPSIMQSPQALQLMASQQRGSIESRYAPLFKALNLPADQLAKFKEFLMEKQNAVRDVMTVARQEGVTDREEIRQLIQQAQADVDNSISALIGSDKFAQYQNFDQTSRQRSVVSQLEQRLWSEPLTSAQSEQLIALLAQNTPARDDGGGRGSFMVSIGGPGMGPPMQFGSGGVPITNQVIQAAQTFLTPGQVDALRQMQAEQADQQQLQQLMRDGSGGGGGGGGGGKFGGKSAPGGKTGGGVKTKSRR